MPTTRGAFTDYAARFVQPGAIEYDRDNAPASVTDVYAVTLPIGVRPALASITGLPAPGERHASYPYLVRAGLTIRNAVEQAGSRVWYVDVAYAPQSEPTTVTNGGGGGEPGVASVVRIVERAWPVYETQADLVADAATGEPVLNAAGEPYDRVPAITRRAIGARVKRLEQNFPSLALSLDGTINKQPVTVLGVFFPSHTARLEVSVEDTLAVGSETRYAVTYDLVPSHNVYTVDAQDEPVDAGWDVPLLEAGFAYKNSDGDLVRATSPAAEGNADPVPSPLPVLLASDGTRLADGADPVVSVWQAYPDTEDWTNLALPTTPTDYDEPPPTP